MSWANATGDYKKQRQLDEARKSGKVEPERDAAGNEINPYIPEFIKNAPCVPGLEHQRVESFDTKKYNKVDDGWYARGQFKGPAVTKFRPGACTNCGSMTHKAKDCVDRPRKLGAKFTGKDIQPDEIVRNVELDWDGKRDRWNGYQADMYRKVMDDFEEADILRRKKLAAKLAEGPLTETDPNAARFPTESTGPGKEKGKLVEQVSNAGLQRIMDPDDPRAVVATNNLRSREDRAKYLHNLDLDSAHYDPKSRSMRENPYAGTDMAPEDVPFRGDNESIFTGDTKEFYNLQRYAWEEYGAPNVAAPSESEVLFNTFKERKQEIEQSKKKQLMSEYGGEEHMSAVPSVALRMGVTEEYKEYAPDGTLLPAYRAAAPKSKYTEDVLINNHTTVWGSWYDRESGCWGYKCCRQTHKQAYCTGEIQSMTDIRKIMPVITPKVENEEVEKRKRSSSSEDSSSSSSSSSSSDSDSSSSDSERRKKKKKRERRDKKDKHRSSRHKKRRRSSKHKKDKSKRERESKRRKTEKNEKRTLENDQISPEQFEEYRRSKQRWDDPMNNSNTL